MKRIMFVIIMLAAGLYAGAQPVAGKFFVGGSLNIWASTDKSKVDGITFTDEKSFNFDFNPRLGYFVSDRIAAGIGLGFSNSVTKFPDDIPDKSTSSRFYFEPFLRYYLISGKAGIFAEASVGTYVGKNKLYYDTTTDEWNNLGIFAGVSPGVYYFITEKLALEAWIGWIGIETDVDKFSDDDKDIYTEFQMSLYPSNISLGLKFIL
ncbi:MAG TPA: hypothetical protein VJ203_04995 [Bacteroidales bacterium]|nr:hypothetical protein [Bacteroidales bacterium]